MNSVNESQYLEDTGPFEGRYLAFLETISTLRPALHRYCARMTGSVMDGEDVVQEALFEAYRKLDQFDQIAVGIIGEGRDRRSERAGAIRIGQSLGEQAVPLVVSISRGLAEGIHLRQ